jgi:hypothetical protein
MLDELPSEKQAWSLKTPVRRSEFGFFLDRKRMRLVCTKAARWEYDVRAVLHLYEMLKARGDWMALGSRDKTSVPPQDSVEAWARSPANPIGGCYGQTRGLEGRFGSFLPPVLERLTRAEFRRLQRNVEMRAV